MKILHVTKKYPNALGGDAVVVKNLEKQQIAKGHKVAILTSNCPDIANEKHVYKAGLQDTAAALDSITPKRLLSLILLFFKAFYVIAKERPDVIHTHSVDMGFFVSFAARLFRKPLVHTFHIVTFNDPRHQNLRGKIELWLLRGANPRQVTILNPADKKGFVKAGFKNVHFVPNGVDRSFWKPGRPASNAIPTFIAVGRLEEQKGFTYLIEAAAKLHAKGVTFKLQIVGEGSLKGDLQSQIEVAGLQKMVVMMGAKTPAELRTMYAKADAFVLSSLWEGMPLTLLEAWSMGLASVTTSVNAIPHIVKDNTLVVEPANVMQLAESMQQLAKSPALRTKLSTQSLKLIESFEWAAVCDSMIKLYKKAAK